MADMNLEQFGEAMEKAPRRLYTALRKRIGDHHRRFLNRFKRERFHGGGAVQTRSSQLVRSFDREIVGHDLDSLVVTTFSAGAPHARIQELGGEVTPKNGNWLTIPLAAAKTAAGVARGSARSFVDTFFLKSKAGNLLIMQKPMTPLFVLKKHVTLQPRLGFLKLWRETQRDLFREIDRASADALITTVTT